MLGFEPDGREMVVVAIKGTFDIPDGEGIPRSAEEQVPLLLSDEFTGEPGLSATTFECDYAHRKPACDVLVHGSAYAPDGRPTVKVPVALQAGPIRKAFHVVGDRRWISTWRGMSSTKPVPFETMPVSYDRAYGGADSREGKPDKIKTYISNPIGVGYYPLSRGKELDGKPLANTEEPRQPARSRTGKYRPMSLGPMSRNFAERVKHAGTYDQRWMDEQAPFWPDDFDYRYFQAAPADQQMPHPQGGEEILVQNMDPGAVLRFVLPDLRMPVIFVPHRGGDRSADARVDTIVIEPSQRRFMLTWRADMPMRRSCFEVRSVVVGLTRSEWHKRARVPGKRRYNNLGELIQQATRRARRRLR